VQEDRSAPLNQYNSKSHFLVISVIYSLHFSHLFAAFLPRVDHSLPTTGAAEHIEIKSGELKQLQVNQQSTTAIALH